MQLKVGEKKKNIGFDKKFIVTGRESEETKGSRMFNWFRPGDRPFRGNRGTKIKESGVKVVKLHLSQKNSPETPRDKPADLEI